MYLKMAAQTFLQCIFSIKGNIIRVTITRLLVQMNLIEFIGAPGAITYNGYLNMANCIGLTTGAFFTAYTSTKIDPMTNLYLHFNIVVLLYFLCGIFGRTGFLWLLFITLQNFFSNYQPLIYPLLNWIQKEKRMKLIKYYSVLRMILELIGPLIGSLVLKFGSGDYIFSTYAGSASIIALALLIFNLSFKDIRARLAKPCKKLESDSEAEFSLFGKIKRLLTIISNPVARFFILTNVVIRTGIKVGLKYSYNWSQVAVDLNGLGFTGSDVKDIIILVGIACCLLLLIFMGERVGKVQARVLRISFLFYSIGLALFPFCAAISPIFGKIAFIAVSVLVKVSYTLCFSSYLYLMNHCLESDILATAHASANFFYTCFGVFFDFFFPRYFTWVLKENFLIEKMAPLNSILVFGGVGMVLLVYFGYVWRFRFVLIKTD